MPERDPHDPRGLIREAYRIEGIEPPSCRSILLDWALDPDLGDPRIAAAALVERHGREAPDHPMTALLQEAAAAPPRRRGGRRRRRAR